MNRIIKSTPNTLTCCNLICGCLAINAAFGSDFTTAFWFVIIATVFDFFDGFAARMLKAYSAIGADLDSLADVVSFGVAPGMIVMLMLTQNMDGSFASMPWIAFAGLMIPAFSALRLAKFNNDTRQSEEFRGLPTPAMALFFVSYAQSYLTLFERHSTALVLVTLGLIVIFCLIMVSDIPMFSFKFKNFGLRKNALRYFFALFSVITVVFMGYGAPALIVGAYILLSLIRVKSAK